MPSADSSSANKRQRTEVELSRKPVLGIKTHSRILAPYRSVGHITSPAVPFSCIPRGSQTFQIITSVGTTLQTYDVRRLNLVFISSPVTPTLIRRVVAWKDFVFAAFGGTVTDSTHGVWIFKRGKKVAELEEPMGGWNKSGWKDMLIFGDWVVGAFGDGKIVVWKVSTKEVHTEVYSAKGGEIVGVIHPSTYLNKVVIARTGGDLQIWNVKTGKLIYTCSPPLNGAKITTIANTTHLHHVAFATSTGQIHIHSILTDTNLFTLGLASPTSSTTSRKRVVSISFCTDSSVGAGTSPEAKKFNSSGSGRILAAGDTDGDITLWDLEKRRIVGVVRAVHSSASGGVLKCEFLPGQKVMVTTGGDNSLKEWIFDSPHTILPRILRQRSGHSAPPTALAFHNPQESHFLLSASQDRTLWGVSLRNDAQSFELSQGSAGVSRKAKKANLKENLVETKAPPVTAIAISDSDGAKRDWENILTAHRGETAARTWHYEMKRLGRWVFATSDGGEVKSVAISACGNFGFVGSSKGTVDMWNLQSGLSRGSFPRKAPVPKKKKGQVQTVPPQNTDWKGHTGAVTSIVTDATNRWITTTGLDGRIKFWELLTGKFLHEIDFQTSGITAARLYRDSDLLAVSCDDLCIRIIDTETKKVVRELWGAGGRISDFCFSNDGRWIVSASTDSTIRIYDLPTGHLIDGIRTPSIVTSLAWSGRGEFLVTGHVDSVGLALWTNRTLFTRIPTRHLKEEDIVDLALPSSSGEGGVSVIDSAIHDISLDDDVAQEDSDTGVYITKDQLSEHMLTLSLVPKTRWQTLLHLDLIKQRNKPTAAPQKPKSAPFFLGALSSIKDGNTGLISNSSKNATNPSANPLYGLPAEEQALAMAEQEAEKSRVLRLQSTNNKLTNGSITTSSALLRQCSAPSPAAFARYIDHFKTLAPASADLEIRSLDTSYWVYPSEEDEEDGDNDEDGWIGFGSHSGSESDSDSGNQQISKEARGPAHTHQHKEQIEEETDELTLFINSLTSRLKLHRDWELVNAWMNVFLKVHGELIIEICSAVPVDYSNNNNREAGGGGNDNDNSKTSKQKLPKRQRRAIRFRDALKEWKEEEAKEGQRISDLAGYCAGVVAFLRSRG